MRLPEPGVLLHLGQGPSEFDRPPQRQGSGQVPQLGLVQPPPTTVNRTSRPRADGGAAHARMAWSTRLFGASRDTATNRSGPQTAGRQSGQRTRVHTVGDQVDLAHAMGHRGGSTCRPRAVRTAPGGKARMGPEPSCRRPKAAVSGR